MFWSSEKAPKEEMQKMDHHCWKSRWEKGQQHHHHHHHHHHYHGAPPTGMMAKYWEKKHCHEMEKAAEAAGQHRRHCWRKTAPKPAEAQPTNEANIKAEDIKVAEIKVADIKVTAEAKKGWFWN